MTRRSALFTLAVLLVVLLVGGRWLALETAERAWAATFSGGGVLIEARTLGRLMQVFVLVFAITWATGNVFVVYRAVGSVQMPRRLGDLEIVEAVPQRVLFALTLGTGLVGGLLLTIGTGDWWLRALLASAPPHFGVSDEILRYDLGYYVAVLPWQSTLQGHAFTWTASATLVVGLLYIAIGSLRIRAGRLKTSDHARAHLAVLLACLALTMAWGAALDPAEVVAGFHGVVDQTAIDVRLFPAEFITVVGIATAIASLMWGWRDRPNLVLGSWTALLLAVTATYAVGPAVVRASRTTDETLLVRRRGALERFAFGLTQLEAGPPPSFPSLEAAVQSAGLPLWDAGRVATRVGAAAPGPAVAFSPSPPAWVVVPSAPHLTMERDTGLVVARAPVRPADTTQWFAPGTNAFAVASPDTWPALRATGIPLRGSLRRAALAWALQGPELTRAETDGRVLLWRRDVAERLARLAPFADFGAPVPVLADSALWWVGWGYVSSEHFPLARELSWRGRPVRYLRAGLVGAVQAATGETHVWRAPGYDSLSAAWARHFEPLIEPSEGIPAGLKTQLAFPPELFQLAAAQLARAAATNETDTLTRRPSEPFQLVVGGTLWTGVALQADSPPPPRLAGLLAGAALPAGPSLRLWRPGPEERLPPDLVGSNETSPGQLRIWVAGDSIVTLQALFAQERGAAPRRIAEVYLTYGSRSGHGSTRTDALQALLSGEDRARVDTTFAGRWEQARLLIARGDSALAAGNLERFGQVWREIRRLLAPARQPR